VGAASPAHVCVIGLILASLPPQSWKVQNDLAHDKYKYEHSDNAVDRAKALGKLGHEEYVAARQALDGGNTGGALQYLKDYDNQATGAHEELLKTGLDPEKHSNGFRQLQISVRERERDLKEIVARVGFEKRQPFEALQASLSALNQKLLAELFPHRPANKQRGEHNGP
jgi:hypothetical protein